MTPEEVNTLKGLKHNLLDQLTQLSDHIADDDDASYELFINLARDTGNPVLLSKAYNKIQKIEDPKEKVGAILQLLDEVEVQLNTSITPATQNETGQDKSYIS